MINDVNYSTAARLQYLLPFGFCGDLPGFLPGLNYPYKKGVKRITCYCGHNRQGPFLKVDGNEK
jgi:hypothetical protein